MYALNFVGFHLPYITVIAKFYVVVLKLKDVNLVNLLFQVGNLKINIGSALLILRTFRFMWTENNFIESYKIIESID